MSRVINGTGYVTDALRDRVLTAMAELGYHPNAVAQGLRRQSMQNIGVLIPRLHEQFFSTLAFAIEKTLFAARYHTLFCNTEEDPDKERAYVNMLISQQVDGVIYFPFAHSRDSLELLLGRGMPVVLVEHVLPGLEANEVLATARQGGYDGVRHLVELGHRRIGVVGVSFRSMSGKERMDGVRDALRKLAVQPDMRVVNGLPDFQTGYRTAGEMLRGPDRPTAIFALTDSIAVGVLHAAAELGLKVPDDLSVMGFDNIPLASYMIPALTTIAQPIYEMGEAAARILLDRLRQKSEGLTTPPQKVVLDTQLIVRQSTQPPA